MDGWGMAGCSTDAARCASSYRSEPARAPRGWGRTRAAALALAGLVGLAPLAACGGDGGTVAETVNQVVIEPDAPLVALGETVQLSASVRDAGGQPLAGRAIVWASADAGVAQVDANGVVTPQRVGVVQLAASSEGQSGIVELRVVPKRVRTVAVGASATRVQVGDTISVQVTATAQDGETIRDRAPTLSTSSPTVAAVSPEQRVVALAPGTTRIVAVVDGVSGDATLEVVPAAASSIVLSSSELHLLPDQTERLAVTVRDRRGNVLGGRAAAFSSSASDVATVGGDGTVRARSPGSATITVTVESATTTALVHVPAPAANPTPNPTPPPGPNPQPTPTPTPTPAPAPVARIVLSTGDFGLRVGESREVRATPLDASGNTLGDRAPTWSTSDGRVASVSPGGVVAALGVGTARIDARAEGRTASLTLTVTPVPVGRVTVTPGSLDLRVGESGQLTATAADASGVPLGGRGIGWNSSAPSVATVSADGLVRAVGPGTATITAASEGIAGAASVAVASVPVVPGVATRLEIVGGDHQQGLQNASLPETLVVRAVDASGRPVPGVFVAWTPTEDGRAAPTLVATDASGLASTRWTLGGKQGNQKMTATTVGAGSVTFNAVAKKR